jgi:hypothetical protein
MSVFNSVGTPLVILVVIIMVGAAVFGISIADAESLNPSISLAKANQINAETEHAQAIYEQEEQVLKVQTGLEIIKSIVDANVYQQRAGQSLVHQKEMQQLELQSYQRVTAAKEQFMIIIGYGLSFAIVLAAILLAAGLILWVIGSTKSKSPEKTQEISTAPNNTYAPLDPWRLPQYKQQMINIARENEKVFLQTIKAGKLNSSSRDQTMTKDEYQNLPLAE